MAGRRPARPPEELAGWIWSLKQDVSLLLDHGHAQAALYPIGRMLDEVQIVKERVAKNMAQNAVMTSMVMSSIPNMSVKAQSTKEAQKAFSEMVTKILGE